MMNIRKMIVPVPLALGMLCFSAFADSAGEAFTPLQNIAYCAANENIDNCAITGKLIGQDTVAYTCSFPSGSTYNFTAIVGTKGAFAYSIINGEAPEFIAHFDYTSPNATKIRTKMYQAAYNAGWRIKGYG